MQALEQLRAHPLAKSEIAQAVITQLHSTARRLQLLQHHYDYSTASTSRKAGLQAAYSMRDPYRGFASASSSDQVFMQAVTRYGSRSVIPKTWQVDIDALGLVPLERWLSWKAAPIRCGRGDSRACIVMVNPRDAFLRDEIEKALGKQLEVEPSPMTMEIIERLLKGERLSTR